MPVFKANYQYHRSKMECSSRRRSMGALHFRLKLDSEPPTTHAPRVGGEGAFAAGGVGPAPCPLGVGLSLEDGGGARALRDVAGRQRPAERRRGTAPLALGVAAAATVAPVDLTDGDAFGSVLICWMIRSPGIIIVKRAGFARFHFFAKMGSHNCVLVIIKCAMSYDTNKCVMCTNKSSQPNSDAPSPCRSQMSFPNSQTRNNMKKV